MAASWERGGILRETHINWLALRKGREGCFFPPRVGLGGKDALLLGRRRRRLRGRGRGAENSFKVLISKVCAGGERGRSSLRLRAERVENTSVSAQIPGERVVYLAGDLSRERAEKGDADAERSPLLEQTVSADPAAGENPIKGLSPTLTVEKASWAGNGVEGENPSFSLRPGRMTTPQSAVIARERESQCNFEWPFPYAPLSLSIEPRTHLERSGKEALERHSAGNTIMVMQQEEERQKQAESLQGEAELPNCPAEKGSL